MSDKYISQEAAIAAIEKPKVTPGGAIFDALKKACQEEVRILPAADVVEVRHGRWLPSGIPDSILDKCSECGFDTGAFTFRYCPNCGAKMDGGQDDGE